MDRRYDVDWLRVCATYLLFVFHVGKVFDPAPFYHIRNADLSFGMLVLCGFIGLWHMPLFFLLAGWSAVSSLRLRGTKGFMRERLLRLALPLLAACVLLMPIIKYFELRSGLDANYAGLWVREDLQQGFRQVIPSGLPLAPPFTQGFLEFLPTFFTHAERFTWAHMWFVAYLLTFTALYRPLFSWLITRRWSDVQPKAWWVYAPIVPLCLVQIFLRPRWPGLQNLYNDWANFAYYTTYLLAGVLLGSAPGIEDVVHREWKRALAIGAATTVVLFGGLLVGGKPFLLLAGSAVAGWCFVVAFLGLAHRFLSSGSAILDYLTESAFPVYILHQVAIVVIGYTVVQLALGIGAKFALLLATSLAVTMAAYHFVIRPFAVPRLLFGMKPRANGRVRMPVPSRTAAALAVAFVALGSTGALGSTPEGLWYAEGGAAAVRVFQCGNALCGNVAWVRSPFDENGCALRDEQNPDERLRERGVEGLEILQGLEPSPGEANVWIGGTIYDPTTGKTYQCRATLEGDRLLLRGYLGIPLLGRTTTWIRVGAEASMCREASQGSRR